MLSTALPATMKSLVHNKLDKTLVLSTVPLPKPGPGEYLIRVQATAFSAGELDWVRPAALNISVPGVDVAATIVSAPAGSRFHPGDKVYARTTFPRPGSAREFSLVLENELAHCPKTIGFVEAATVPMSAETAWQALFDHGGLTVPVTWHSGAAASNDNGTAAQKRVLVTGAMGGVGLWVVQLAKLAGAYVIGTCSTSNVETVRGLGADEVVDYRVTSLKDWAATKKASEKVDLVVDCVGPEAQQEAWWTLKDGGLMLTLVPPPDYSETLVRPEGVSESISGRFFIMHPDGAQLGQVSELIDAGLCRPIVDSEWRFQDWETALAKVNSRHARGKVVLKIGSDV